MASKLKAKKPTLDGPKRAKTVIFGPPKSWKTSVSATFPGCYFIDTEGGATRDSYRQKLLDVGAVYLGPEDGTLNPEFILEQIKALATERHDYKTLVLDSYTAPWLKQIGDATEKFITKHGDDTSDFGSTKKSAIAWSRRLLNWIDRMDMNVLLIAHEKDLWKGGEMVGKTFDGWEKLSYYLDLIIRVELRGSQSYAIVNDSRHEKFPKLDSFLWNYEEFANRYGREVLEGKSKNIELASPEQLERLNLLLEVVKVPESEIEKWFDAAKVESWAEMDAARIEKAINYLQGRITR